MWNEEVKPGASRGGQTLSLDKPTPWEKVGAKQ